MAVVFADVRALRVPVIYKQLSRWALKKTHPLDLQDIESLVAPLQILET